jgi:peptidoglycan/xylan/chitin deacetylase (PgdA/CDA1 family)
LIPFYQKTAPNKLFLLIIAFLLLGCRSITQRSAEPAIGPSQIILSFDDGPNAFGDTTARLLDVLEKYEVKAMFALLGENAEKNPGLVRRIYDEGHLIINHGYYDKWAGGMEEEEFRNNLKMGEAAISKALGSDFFPKLYRPHGGFYSYAQEKIIREVGYTIVFADLRVYDAVLSEVKKDKAIKELIEKAKKQNGGIVLLHDGRGSQTQMEKELEKNQSGAFNRSWLPAAVEEIIAALKAKGFTIVNPHLSE